MPPKRYEIEVFSFMVNILWVIFEMLCGGILLFLTGYFIGLWAAFIIAFFIFLLALTGFNLLKTQPEIARIEICTYDKGLKINWLLHFLASNSNNVEVLWSEIESYSFRNYFTRASGSGRSFRIYLKDKTYFKYHNPISKDDFNDFEKDFIDFINENNKTTGLNIFARPKKVIDSIVQLILFSIMAFIFVTMSYFNFISDQGTQSYRYFLSSSLLVIGIMLFGIVYKIIQNKENKETIPPKRED